MRERERERQREPERCVCLADSSGRGYLPQICQYHIENNLI